MKSIGKILWKRTLEMLACSILSIPLIFLWMAFAWPLTFSWEKTQPSAFDAAIWMPLEGPQIVLHALARQTGSNLPDELALVFVPLTWGFFIWCCLFSVQTFRKKKAIQNLYDLGSTLM